MRFAPALRKVNDMWRSSTIAAPRAVVRDWSDVMPSSATGESFGKRMLTDPPGSGFSCASAAMLPANARIANCRCRLLRIDFGDGHVASLGIDCARSDGALRIRGISHAACPGEIVLQLKR